MFVIQRIFIQQVLKNALELEFEVVQQLYAFGVNAFELDYPFLGNKRKNFNANITKQLDCCQGTTVGKRFVPKRT